MNRRHWRYSVVEWATKTVALISPLYRSNKTMSESALDGSSNRLSPENQLVSNGDNLLGDKEIVVEGFLFQSFNTYEELLDSVRKEESVQIRVRPFNISATVSLLSFRHKESIFLGFSKRRQRPTKPLLRAPKTILGPFKIRLIEIQLLLTPSKPFPHRCSRYTHSNGTWELHELPYP